MHSDTDTSEDVFLPDLCAVGAVFSVVVVGELLAFVLVLTPAASGSNPWQELAMISLFVQWVGLASAGALCLLRRPLRRTGDIGSGLLAWLLVMAIAALASEAAYWLVAQHVIDFNLRAVWQTTPASPWFSQPNPYDAATATTLHIEFLMRNVAIAGIVSAVALRYLFLQHQAGRRARAAARSRIQALQSRIRPHFLFNSMNTIASLIRREPAKAERVVEDLSDLFRISLADARVAATMAEELAIARQYLHIESLRLGDRLRVAWQVDALPGDACLPALTLQPLLENAVYHGVEPVLSPATIRIEGTREGDRLALSVSNPVAADAVAGRRGNQLAQTNVAERLRAFFGTGAQLQVVAGHEEYLVCMRFPYRRDIPDAIANEAPP